MKTLQDIKKHPAVYFVSDERKNGEGIWIYLRGDYWCDDMECRTIHEHTIPEIIEKFRSVRLLK
jgi:hypothetical protein